MKNIYFLTFLAITLFACSSDSSESDSCGTVSLLNVTQDSGTIDFAWMGQENFNYFEIGFDITSNLTGQPINDIYFNYSFVTTQANTVTKSLQELNIQPNYTYSFYVRAQCTNGELTPWQGPIVREISDYCQEPYDLDAQGSAFYWDDYYNTTEASYYQVEYGLQGFQLGSGEQITTNDQSTFDAAMSQGNTYDFYVRSYCENNLGWSSWVGPVSSFADQDYNLCTPPSNVLAGIEYNFFGDAVGAVFEWSFNGESNFEYVVVNDGYDPNSGSVNTYSNGWPFYNLAQNTNYDFYVRAVCVDGSRTEWVGPKNINIGS